jgi:hypothetical protein
MVIGSARSPPSVRRRYPTQAPATRFVKPPAQRSCRWTGPAARLAGGVWSSTACDATELRRLIGAREISAGDCARPPCERSRGRPAVNAVVGSPYEDATAAEYEPLVGVPFAVKDTLPQAGRPLRFGSRMLDGFVARRQRHPCRPVWRGRPGLAGPQRHARVRVQHRHRPGHAWPDAQPVESGARPGRIERRVGGARGVARRADGAR